MRLAIRWLAFLIPASILLLYLQRTGSPTLGSSLRPQSPPHENTPPISAYDSIDQSQGGLGAFWKRWSKAMHEARPNASAISLAGTASTLAPSDAKGPRKPYRDHVLNSATDIELLRQSHGRFVGELDSIDTDNDVGIFKGRGVVMVGGGEYFGPAIIGIHMLRRTGSTLPVEVFVPNDDEYESEVCEVYLAKLNAKCVVLAEFLSQEAQDGGALPILHYQLKAAALLLSSFSEVLLLDSDSIPVLNPDRAIFESEPYLTHGLITWPDFWGATESPRFWDIAGLSEYPARLPSTSSESGQLVINKKTHLASLLLATYYNVFGQDYYYPLLSQGALGQGDKETFMAAAVALNSTYYRVKTGASSLGRHNGAEVKGTAIVQYLPYDDSTHSDGGKDTIRPVFLHSNTPKMNAGHLVDEGDLMATDGHSRLRLLGDKASTEKLFKFDVEDSLWDLLVQTGCELADVIREWRDRERLCERLTEHHLLLFGEVE
jgi:alpha 1,2-mannosyltransferase